MLAAAGVALADPGNGNGGGNGNPNGCDNGNAGQHNPNCPTTTVNPYPVNSTFEVRDANGNLIDGTHGLHVGDMMNIVSAGWQPGSAVAFDFFSTAIHLGDVKADTGGVVRASYAVPQVEPGMHTLRLTGTGKDGQPRVVEYPILVIGNTAVLGRTLTNATGSGSSNAGFFGKTGLDHAMNIAGIGLALLAVGLVLTLAVRRSRRGDPAI